MGELMEKIDRLTTKFSGQDLCETCLVEELAELIQAVQHVTRKREGVAAVAEEIAHVTIMIEAYRKKYAIETGTIMYFEADMCRRYLNDDVWDGSHVPSTVHTSELV